MDNNFKRVKSLLKKHGYEIYVSIDKDSQGVLKTFLPGRKETPIVEEMVISYFLDFKNNLIEYTLNSTPGDPIDCKSYAFVHIIFADIEKMCQFYGYDTNLLGFYKDGLQLDKEEFEKAAFPDSNLSKQDIKKRKLLSSLLDKSKILKFTIDETLEPGYDQVKDEYMVIKTMITGKQEEDEK
jgi:hypothetical protein